MSNPTTLTQMQDEIKDIVVKMFNMNAENVNSNIVDTISQKAIRITGAQKLEGGHSTQVTIIVRQIGENKFQVAGTGQINSDTFTIGGKEVRCKTEQLPTAVMKIITISRTKRPQKKRRFSFGR